MDTSIIDGLLANPYRIFGLPAGAGQNDIDLAARRMRIWNNAAEIPPTPWDFPEFGPVPRGKPDLEKAVGQLLNPATRLIARATWFTALPGQLTTVAQQSAAAGQAASIQQAHDSTLHRLFLLAQKSPDIFSQYTGWCSALGQFFQTLCRPEYLTWFLETETSGNFEKPARELEVAALADLWAAELLPQLRRLGNIAYDCSAFEQTVAFIRLGQLVAPNNPESGQMRRIMLELMERNLLSQCPRMQNELYRFVQTIRFRGIFSGRKNRARAALLDSQLRQFIVPQYYAFIKLQAPEMERARGVRTAFEAMARNMAVAWSRLGAGDSANTWRGWARSNLPQRIGWRNRLGRSWRFNRVSWLIISFCLTSVIGVFLQRDNWPKGPPTNIYLPPSPSLNRPAHRATSVHVGPPFGQQSKLWTLKNYGIGKPSPPPGGFSSQPDIGNGFSPFHINHAPAYQPNLPVVPGGYGRPGSNYPPTGVAHTGAR